jgi:hypothetical protein
MWWLIVFLFCVSVLDIIGELISTSPPRTDHLSNGTRAVQR